MQTQSDTTFLGGRLLGDALTPCTWIESSRVSPYLPQLGALTSIQQVVKCVNVYGFGGRFQSVIATPACWRRNVGGSVEAL